jgi:hypothetical protein
MYQSFNFFQFHRFVKILGVKIPKITIFFKGKKKRKKNCKDLGVC